MENGGINEKTSSDNAKKQSVYLVSEESEMEKNENEEVTEKLGITPFKNEPDNDVRTFWDEVWKMSKKRWEESW